MLAFSLPLPTIGAGCVVVGIGAVIYGYAHPAAAPVFEKPPEFLNHARRTDLGGPAGARPPDACPLTVVNVS